MNLLHHELPKLKVFVSDLNFLNDLMIETALYLTKTNIKLKYDIFNKREREFTLSYPMIPFVENSAIIKLI